MLHIPRLEEMLTIRTQRVQFLEYRVKENQHLRSQRLKRLRHLKYPINEFSTSITVQKPRKLEGEKEHP